MGVESDRHTGERVHARSFRKIIIMDRITEEKIKSAANVVDVISDFLTLRKRGVEYVCLCPFHADENLGNFSINPVKGVYKCFACGAGGDAIKFLMEYRESRLSYGDALRYLAKKYSISIPDDDNQDARWQHIKPAKPKQIVEVHKEMIVHPRDDVKGLMTGLDKNIFVTWLRSLPWNDDQRKRLEQVLWLYCVGHWPRDGRVVFWQIDEQGRPHGGKMMLYHPGGKRYRKEKDGDVAQPRWVHNQDGYRNHLDLDHHQFHPTLFGMHLLKKYPEATVNIVESEKTALFTATMYGNMEKQLWIACGGLEFLKVEALRPLIEQGRRVWIWPDKDGVEKWKKKIGHLISDNFGIYTRFFDKYWIEEDGKKADMADINLRLLTRPETINDVKLKEVSDDEKILLACQEWTVEHDNDPFIDPLEAIDTRVAEWREILRQRYNFINNK